MPEPRLVAALGDCALGCNLLADPGRDRRPAGGHASRRHPHPRLPAGTGRDRRSPARLPGVGKRALIGPDVARVGPGQASLFALLEGVRAPARGAGDGECGRVQVGQQADAVQHDRWRSTRHSSSSAAGRACARPAAAARRPRRRSPAAAIQGIGGQPLGHAAAAPPPAGPSSCRRGGRIPSAARRPPSTSRIPGLGVVEVADLRQLVAHLRRCSPVQAALERADRRRRLRWRGRSGCWSPPGR